MMSTQFENYEIVKSFLHGWGEKIPRIVKETTYEKTAYIEALEIRCHHFKNGAEPFG